MSRNNDAHSSDQPAQGVEPPTVSIEIPDDEAITVRRTMQVQRREAWVGWTTVIANVLVPLSIAAAVYGLLEASWRDQRDASTRQIELFYSENLTDAQTMLFSLWTDLDLTVLRTPQSRAFIDAFVERTIEASPVEKGKVTGAIVTIASYFDRVETCIDSKRCDDQEIVTQLGQYGRDFYCIYAGQMAALRQNTLVFSLGLGLEEFAARAGGCGSD